MTPIFLHNRESRIIHDWLVACGGERVIGDHALLPASRSQLRIQTADELARISNGTSVAQVAAECGDELPLRDRSLTRLPVDTMISHHRAMRRGRTLLFAICALLGACARNQPSAETTNARAEIVFANESLTQAELYAVVSGGGEARRLGTVMAGRTETLHLGADLALRGGISLVARLLNGGTVSTGVVPIHPGDTVHVQLPLNHNTLVFLP